MDPVVLTVNGKQHDVSDGTLHAMQQAFLREEAFQCGYCTSGMILSAVALINGDKNPTKEEIVRVMNGNICRCGTYPRILAAIHDATQTAQRKN